MNIFRKNSILLGRYIFLSTTLLKDPNAFTFGWCSVKAVNVVSHYKFYALSGNEENAC